MDAPPLHDSHASLASAQFRVHKFGGSSLADASRIGHVAGLMLAADESHHAVVVSAMHGVTDRLIAVGDAAARGDDWQPSLASLQQHHLDAAEALLEDCQATREWLHLQFDQLGDVLRAIALLRQPGHAALARIHGMGEVLSSQLLHACLRERGGDYARLDAREVLRVRHGELGAIVDWDASALRLADWRLANPQPRVVVTGFIASDADGQPTLLGRNGSDFSAAIFASLFDADEVHLWSDRAKGFALHCVARLDVNGSAKFALQELPNDHAFAHLRLTDNCVQFTTHRYRDNPLVVQGPGAGPDVTAAGVFSDLLRLASSLGARV